MRTLIVTTFLSLDGVMQAPGGEPGYAHTGWVGRAFSEGLLAYKLEEQLAAGTLLLGRATFESFRDSWPDRDGPMAEKINAMRKVVVSRTLTAPEWAGTTVLPELTEASVAALKEAPGEDGPILVVGSRSVAQWLLRRGLVDALHLQVFPLVLGSGDRLFPEGPDALPFELVDSTPLPNGVLAQRYVPAAASTASAS